MSLVKLTWFKLSNQEKWKISPELSPYLSIRTDRSEQAVLTQTRLDAAVRPSDQDHPAILRTSTSSEIDFHSFAWYLLPKATFCNFIFQGPVVQSVVSNELVSGQNFNCSSKYNIKFIGIFAEKCG